MYIICAEKAKILLASRKISCAMATMIVRMAKMKRIAEGYNNSQMTGETWLKWDGYAIIAVWMIYNVIKCWRNWAMNIHLLT